MQCFVITSFLFILLGIHILPTTVTVVVYTLRASTTSLTPGLTGWSLLRSKTVHFKTDKIIESWVVVFVFHFQSSSISVLTRVRLSSYHADIPNCLPDVCVITDSSILKPLILKKLLLVVSIKDALHGNSSSSSVKYVKGAQCFN